MFVFRNSLGIGQHNRLMINAGDIDFTGGGSNNPNPHDAPDINNGKGDKTDLDKPDNKPDNKPMINLTMEVIMTILIINLIIKTIPIMEFLLRGG